MNQNRLDVRLRPEQAGELQAVRLEKGDVHEKIPVDVKMKLGATAIIGIVLSVIGAILVIVAAVLFGFAYPEGWFVDLADSVDEVQSNIELVEILFGLGFILLLTGSSFFFFGRSHVGSGRSSGYNLREGS
ncbi:MAG: hypothetical protein ACPGQL_05230 [Thermoplasmatota archaeon]